MDNENKIVVLCGKSSVGKSALTKYISEHYDYKTIVSTTTRPPRPNETNGIDYHFVAKEQFQKLIDDNEMLEHRDYAVIQDGKPAIWTYGVQKSSINTTEPKQILVLELNGLKVIKEVFSDNVIAFYIDLDDSEREYRGRNRDGFDKEEWERRWEQDKEDFKPEIVKSLINFKVENYDFDTCVHDIMTDIYAYEEGVM